MCTGAAKSQGGEGPVGRYPFVSLSSHGEDVAVGPVVDVDAREALDNGVGGVVGLGHAAAAIRVDLNLRIRTDGLEEHKIIRIARA